MSFLFTAAVSATYVTYHYATPIIFTACSAIAGAIGGYFWNARSQSSDPELAEKLQALQNETIQRRQNRDGALERLASTTESVLKETASSSHEMSQRIEITNQTLESETELLKTVHRQLRQVSTLIEQLGESVEQQGEPLFSELKHRISELSAVYEKLSETQQTLAETVDQLQQVVQKHQRVQEQLQSSAILDQNAVKILSTQLENSNVKNKAVGHQQEGATKPLQPNPENPQTNPEALKSLIQLYRGKLKEAGEEISKLRRLLQPAEKATLSKTREPILSSPAGFFHHQENSHDQSQTILPKQFI